MRYKPFQTTFTNSKTTFFIFWKNLQKMLKMGKYGGGSDSPISIVPHLKLTSVLILKGPYSMEKCATCLDTFLRF